MTARLRVRDLQAQIRAQRRELLAAMVARDEAQRKARDLEDRLNSARFVVEVEAPVSWPAERWDEARDRAKRLLDAGVPTRVRFRKVDP